MKEKEAARLKVFCARKELTPFEHLSSNNVPSFISREHTTDPLLVEHVLWVVFQQRGYIFFRSASAYLPEISCGTSDRHWGAWRLEKGGGGWIVMANAYWVLVMCQFPSKQFTWIPSIILHNWPSYGVGLLNSPTLQMGKLRLKNLSKGS